MEHLKVIMVLIALNLVVNFKVGLVLCQILLHNLEEWLSKQLSQVLLNIVNLLLCCIGASD